MAVFHVCTIERMFRGARVVVVVALAFACSAPDVRPPRHAKVLLVGTPGDYAPFAVCEGKTGNACHGHDVDLVQAFATHSGFRVQFVRSSWATLGDELTKRRFMMAVGGISVTDERTQKGPFGEPLLRTGKQAVLRCEDREKFALWRDVTEQARLVANRGGTNENFARHNFSARRLTVVERNQDVPGTLVRGEVDVFFTDGPEARLLSAQSEALCIGLGGKLYEPFDLAFWFGDDALRDEFDAFLRSPGGQKEVRQLSSAYGLSATNESQ